MFHPKPIFFWRKGAKKLVEFHTLSVGGYHIVKHMLKHLPGGGKKAFLHQVFSFVMVPKSDTSNMINILGSLSCVRGYSIFLAWNRRFKLLVSSLFCCCSLPIAVPFSLLNILIHAFSLAGTLMSLVSIATCSVSVCYEAALVSSCWVPWLTSGGNTA